ncbi:MAG: VCBS repeat-containing protein [Peptococcaceae bacterium]|nr:MAG: VCBS repeat-containing protein [Peptococcaceae bacterium]
MMTVHREPGPAGKRPFLRITALIAILVVVAGWRGYSAWPGRQAKTAANRSAAEDFAGFRKEKLELCVRDPLTGSSLIKNASFDLDGDGMDESYSLQEGKLRIETGSRTIWQSPDEWWVDDFLLGDADNDGIPDLNLLVWKAGSFGPHKPFWITAEDKSVKNHLFIFNLVHGAVKPVWQSSNLDRPNYGIALADIDKDSKNELIATEGDYADPEVRQVSVWRWNGWGFSRVSGDDFQNGVTEWGQVLKYKNIIAT